MVSKKAMKKVKALDTKAAWNATQAMKGMWIKKNFFKGKGKGGSNTQVGKDHRRAKRRRSTPRRARGRGVTTPRMARGREVTNHRSATGRGSTPRRARRRGVRTPRRRRWAPSR